MVIVLYYFNVLIQVRLAIAGLVQCIQYTVLNFLQLQIVYLKSFHFTLLPEYILLI